MFTSPLDHQLRTRNKCLPFNLHCTCVRAKKSIPTKIQHHASSRKTYRHARLRRGWPVIHWDAAPLSQPTTAPAAPGPDESPEPSAPTSMAQTTNKGQHLRMRQPKAQNPNQNTEHAQQLASTNNHSVEDSLYINNAGLVILHPFLPKYFSMLGMLEGDVFRDEAAAIRGVLLLEGEENWSLRVESEGFDVLLSFLPWTISLVKLPWMGQQVEVTWKTGS